ncbi:MAG: translation initiation factor IF-2 subunit gamma [Candidatus Nanoarchaeia archaeon]|jgi:translation initiation factor 2 subunit 3|nr:translation initiation factor IF-2 subunit gamma [Candidatus Nanoarchaeia archaeon]MDD4563317.1 translation initiation factor IF-2 subunit gamma [Candidatus Nanoarchaeia archaeon]
MEQIDISKIKTINIGIVGHIDHGKTTLLQQLSGKWADTHSEELKRGITIKLGYADALIREENNKLTIDKNSQGKPKRYITFIDAPGHEMLMATMLLGASIIDAAILVVAANEGIKPQTQEHLTALEAKNIKNIIIAQNKIDLVTKEQAQENYKKIKEFLKGTIAENAPIIPICAQQGINLEAIFEELCKLEIPKFNKEDKPIFYIARSFDVNKPGTPVEQLHGGIFGGVLKQGSLKVGDTIEIKPGYSYKKHNELKYKTIYSKIISLHKGNYNLNQVFPGGSIAIETELDPTLTKADSLSGAVISTKNNLPEIIDKIKIDYKLFKKMQQDSKIEEIQDLKISEMLMLSANTSITVGKIIKKNNNEIELELKIPIVPLKNEPIGIARNINGHWRLIGYGNLR